MSWRSFSFADYCNPANIRFSSLRVINEGIVQPGTGFDTHGHRDVEIFTYVLNGAAGWRAGAGYDLDNGRRAYLHVARGSLQTNGNALSAGYSG